MLKASPFLGEGHRKVKARLAARGIRVGKNLVLRLMREHGCWHRCGGAIPAETTPPRSADGIPVPGAP